MTEPRKTPRTEAAELPWVANTQVACYGPCVKADFARALEIETQELAESLEDMVAIYSEDDIDDEFPALSRARAILARHRAKQEAAR